jgi:soluble lytic murein transglycosylase
MIGRLLLSILMFLRLILSESIASEINKAVFTHINNRSWQEAEELVSSTGHDILTRIVLSQKFLDTNYKDNNFEEIVDFLRKYPEWPQSSNIRKKAEKYLTYSTNPQVVIDWFAKNKPQTGIGYKFYALASAKLLGNEDSINALRNGWIYGDFNAIEEKQYYTEYQKHLRAEDNVRKVEKYLWAKDITKARQLMHLIPPIYKKTLLAEIAALEGSSSKDALFAEVKEELYTDGLLFQYLHSKRKETPNNISIRLFKKAWAKRDKHHEKDWCKLQLYYAREFIQEKDFKSSYAVLSNHFSSDPEDVREVQWLAGWLSLRFLNKPHIAQKHFQEFLHFATTPISIARGKYWLARTTHKLSDKDKARSLYKEASIHSHTFYGQLANIELQQNKLILPASPKIEIAHQDQAKNNDIIKAIKILIDNNKTELAQIYAKHGIKHAKNKSEIALIVKMIAESSDNLSQITDIAKIASHNHVFLKNYVFPTPYKIANKPIEAPLAYAIIRQESIFNQHAVSSANAMGLMQLIKATACGTAKSLGISCNVSRLTKDHQYNIKLGTNHFRDLLKTRDGSLVLSIASYNTDPKNVTKWLGIFGDPRKMQKLEQIIDWLELIPFGETRNYVQRVLENLQVYRAILYKNNHLKLKQDLTIGL